ncbi:phosphoribosylglycinamide formyltransferase, chloroplastic-like [Actinidia eriantha]|uniref:phosphoribosylglycinamide formyltransferase, chloroplastic-like n=1 Tax=Actinidia eriantha TaxID=165200 RepID=UPI00258B6BED|nr:phosphoribosylglycinamide formyltransferase, chloroplastic-like [Actinidia eriantha]
MEAQIFLLQVYSNSIITPIQKPKKTYFISLLSSSSPSSSQIVNPNRVSFKTLYPISSQSESSINRLRCRNRSREVKAVSGDIEDPRTRVRKNLAVFVSGGGSNFRSIHEAIFRGSVHGEIAVLVTNKPGCGGAEYARDNNIPVILFPKMKEKPDSLSANDLVTALRRYKVDFILLAGYLKLMPIELVQAYPRSILNIHPSLLPAFGGKDFYGMKVHQTVIASGARYSGPTIHFVDEHYDTGRILAQRVVPVLANDTADELAARVLQKEHQLYVEVAAALCEERIVWREDGVPLIRTKENPNDYS